MFRCGNVTAIARDPLAGFWRGHVRLGVISTMLLAGIGIAYCASTFDQPNRTPMITVAALALISCPLILSGPGTRAFTGPHRERWLYAWSGSLLVAVMAAAMLDGGGASPLAWLFAASLVFTASGFGRLGAIVMGATTVGCYLIVAAYGWPGPWHVLMTVAALIVIAGTCTLSSGRLLASLKAQKRLTEQLEVRAAHDGLTGLLNHSTLVEHLALEVTRAHRESRPMAFVMMDLDDFKGTNDTYGHVAADELLASVGVELRRSVRPYDLVGRVGGDEFAIVVPDTDENEAHQLAERVRRRLNAVCTPFSCEISVGVGVLRPGDDARSLRQRADEALYVAKRGTTKQV